MTEQERDSYVNQYKGTKFQHIDGGVYEFQDFSLSADDGVTVYISYKHLWPFKQQLWHRIASEWTHDRFNPITNEYASSVMSEDRTSGQDRVKANKAARKATKND